MCQTALLGIAIYYGKKAIASKATLPFRPKTAHFLKACLLGYLDSLNLTV